VATSFMFAEVAPQTTLGEGFLHPTLLHPLPQQIGKINALPHGVAATGPTTASG
jgi:hypothetical protein